MRELKNYFHKEVVMKQLETKASSPWEIKEAEVKTPTSALWDKPKEEQKAEEKKKEPKERTHYRYYLQFPPFGSYVFDGCLLSHKPPETYAYPFPDSETGVFVKAGSPIKAMPSKIMIFERDWNTSDAVMYVFRGMR